MANYSNGTIRESIYGAMQYIQWESCGTANCLPSVLGPQPSNCTCSLGRLASYYVKVQRPDHITTVLQFARSHNIRISIKNTGHDYLGRSSSPNSLAIWTAGLKNMSYHANFTGYHCSAADGQNIGVIGAGVTADESAAFFDQYGMTSIVGQCPTTGPAGGYGQGGGH
ncbi:MAG: hypothetical protein LQ340_001844, partial [Diploschistes diacapsis]